MITTPKLLELSPKDIIVRTNFNTRYDMGDLRTIKANMEANGYDPSQPLIVRKDLATDDKYLLGSQGHRRLTVARELMDEGKLRNGIVYAIEEDEELSDADRNLDILRLNTGEPLPMLAQARVISRAYWKVTPVDGTPGEAAITKRDLARKIGVSDTFVGNCLKLLETTAQTQKWIEKEKVSSMIVIELYNEYKGDVEKVESRVEELIALAESKGKTKAKKEKVSKEEPSDDDDTDKEEQKLQKAILKGLLALEKRVLKAAEWVKELDAEKSGEGSDEVTKAAINSLYMLVAHLVGGEENDLVQGSVSLSDVKVNFKTLITAHKSTVKEVVATVKAEAKATVAGVKEAAKEKVAAAKAKGKK